ncbi:MAG: hypothetical protein HQ546_06870 [Planctomycetes bacterium]|nr:hypothetical protein [Planctomycetota bacterium]
MAVITSNNSGDWVTDANWVGGVAPDLTVDDAVVDAAHKMDLQTGQSLTLPTGRSITVTATGGIDLKAGSSFTLNSGTLTHGGTTANYFYIRTNADFIMRSGSLVLNAPYTSMKGHLHLYGGTITTTGGIFEVDGTGCLLEMGGGALVISNTTSFRQKGLGLVRFTRRGSKIVSSTGVEIFDLTQAYGFASRPKLIGVGI